MLDLPIELWTIIIEHLDKIIDIGIVNNYFYCLTLNRKIFNVDESNVDNFFSNNIQYSRLRINLNAKLEYLIYPREIVDMSGPELLVKMMSNNNTFNNMQNLYNELKNRPVFPNSLTHLTFGIYFDQEIKTDVLPQALTHLTFGAYFNQEIKAGVLPQALTHLL